MMCARESSPTFRTAAGGSGRQNSCEFRACGPAKYGGKEMSHEDEEVPQLSTTNVIREHENQDGGISIKNRMLYWNLLE
jgi:hypothetical protein